MVSLEKFWALRALSSLVCFLVLFIYFIFFLFMKRIHLASRSVAMNFQNVLLIAGYYSYSLSFDCFFDGGVVLYYHPKAEMLVVALLNFHACDYHFDV